MGKNIGMQKFKQLESESNAAMNRIHIKKTKSSGQLKKPSSPLAIRRKPARRGRTAWADRAAPLGIGEQSAHLRQTAPLTMGGQLACHRHIASLIKGRQPYSSLANRQLAVGGQPI